MDILRTSNNQLHDSDHTYIIHIHWSDFIHGIFCPGSVLPVHPDAVKDDGEADVEDEVDGENKYTWIKVSRVYTQDDEPNHVEEKEAISESKVNFNQFVVLHSYSMHFQAGKDKIDCWTNKKNNLWTDNAEWEIIKF